MSTSGNSDASDGKASFTIILMRNSHCNRFVNKYARVRGEDSGLTDGCGANEGERVVRNGTYLRSRHRTLLFTEVQTSGYCNHGL